METLTQESVRTKTFLERRKVKLVPVIRKGKWTLILDNDREESYMFPKAKRSYTLPVSLSRGGQLVQVLDNETKYITPEFSGTPMTEQEYFEKKLGRRLGIYEPASSNFWKSAKEARVTVKKEGAVFNLSDPVDYIRVKILKANVDTIAPSWEERFNKASYQFALVDEEVEASNKAELRKIKDEAYEHYLSIKSSKKKLADFLKVAGKRIKGSPDTMKETFLLETVTDILEKNPHEYLRIANDPHYKTKVILLDGVMCGAVLSEGKGKYILPTGVHLGESERETIMFLKDPVNRDVLDKILNQINNSKTGT